MRLLVRALGLGLLIARASAQCTCAAGMPPTSAPYSMISGDAGCVINFLEIFDTSGTSIFASGNVASRVGPFEITCPGAFISSFSFHCNDGTNGYPVPTYASFNTISDVICTNGAAAQITGLNNVCGSTVGTIARNPATGTCSACTPGPCTGATACSSTPCSIGPSPLDAPWPMLGRDPAHRSCSPFSGPQVTPAVLWSTSGGAFDGVTIANDGAVFSSISALNTLTAYNGDTGAIRWLNLDSVNGSTTWTIGPAFTIIGFVGGQNLGALLQATGRGVQNIEASGLPSDVTLAADGSLAISFHHSPGGYNFLVYAPITYAAILFFQGAESFTVPAVAASTYFYGAQATLYARTFTASLWSYTSTVGNITSPSVSHSGTVFVGTDQGYMVAVNNATGQAAWAVSPCPQPCRANYRALSALSPDDSTLFFPVGRIGGVGYAGVIALATSTGATLWTLATNDDVRSLALDASGTLFVGDASGSIYGVHAVTGAVTWTFSIAHSAVANLALGANGALYVATNTSLVALR